MEKFLGTLFILAIILAFLGVGALLFQLAINFILPTAGISYLQSLGLLILGNIFFGASGAKKD